MEAIRFLAVSEVSEIHTYQVRTFGGSDGVRDFGLLESALAAPQAGFGGRYLYSDIFEMAAAYLVSLVGNHPFVDGNKRAGAMTAAVFLELNDVEFLCDPDDYANLVIRVAEGKIDVKTAAAFFRKCV